MYSNYQLYENMNDRDNKQQQKKKKKKKTNFVHTIQEISALRGRKELCNQCTFVRHIRPKTSCAVFKDWNHYFKVSSSDEKHKLSLIFVKPELEVYIKLS